jgi:hypothetical protein
MGCHTDPCVSRTRTLWNAYHIQSFLKIGDVLNQILLLSFKRLTTLLASIFGKVANTSAAPLPEQLSRACDRGKRDT